MDTLDGTEWDVLIVGTGIQQSLLALSLSRSDKKILHIDPNPYYGGVEAAFALKEAEEFVTRHQGSGRSIQNAKLALSPSLGEDAETKLAPSRSYSLALAPQLLYTQSALLPALVTSRLHTQLDFLAVGSWWVYSSKDGGNPSQADEGATGFEERHPRSTLTKVPAGREDVFADKTVDIRSKRSLMKFLRFVGEYEKEEEAWQPFSDAPFQHFLQEHFHVPSVVQAPLMALTMSQKPSEETRTDFALPRIARHLRSIGLFGPGFGAVLPKWGGLSEIAQVACRACAVGGGVYVLGKGLAGAPDQAANSTDPQLSLKLTGEDTVRSRIVVGSQEGLTSVLPPSAMQAREGSTISVVSRSISIVSSSLSDLFPPFAEGSPPPAGAVVVLPSGSFSTTDDQDPEQGNQPPVHILIHSSESGECPYGQSVLYASVDGAGNEETLKHAVASLLDPVQEESTSKVLWSMYFEHKYHQPVQDAVDAGKDDRVLVIPETPQDLTFDDSILDSVKEIWQKVMGPDVTDFLVFEERESNLDDDDEEV
ncbi:hypothetical protein P152DRAFT_468583 [Eremomyces bilateralis CBS 781.70]|uniref:Rab proteins geranylgeranyltransferase n=1 Tax=Eremomyces bilateralis CBS 781.70 TaxID=1392243 RepID=A0A6G1FU09_9PEZI|nr:uncharacterized protein P152DRAFT_468583 [Eremomyces bilateralis CBS 781.70]KAF1809159.1 hypothetical protein P152DRAFT_468583 [Eremomyces bilateralis CBS 781.70]